LLRFSAVDVRERSLTLKVNYRTSHQIREKADRLLPGVLADVDGREEQRDGTVSVFNGPVPVVALFDTSDQETQTVAQFVRDAVAEGVKPDEFALFVRTRAAIPRARAAVTGAGLEAANSFRTALPCLGPWVTGIARCGRRAAGRQHNKAERILARHKVAEERRLQAPARKAHLATLLAELQSLSPEARLLRVARDDSIPLGALPNELIVSSLSGTAALDTQAREALLRRIDRRQAGVWKELRQRLIGAAWVSKEPTGGNGKLGKGPRPR